MKKSEILARLKANGCEKREAEVVGVDVESRTVELAFSSEAEVSRWFGVEVLSHDAEAVDLARLNDGGAVLDGHVREKQCGVVESAWIDADRVGRAKVRFSRSAAGEEMLQDIADGIKRHVSVGYQIHEMELTERRENVDVYTATRWAAHEISIVSIPADTSVGVGRSADCHSMKSLATGDHRSSNAQREPNHMLHKTLLGLIDDAMRAQSKRAHTPAGMHEPTVYLSAPMARSTVACLKTVSLPALFGKDGRLRRTPSAAPSGSTVKMDAGLVAGSRVAGAGAHVLIIPEASKPHLVGPNGTVVMESVPVRFSNIEAAVFGTVAVDDDLAPLITLPVFSASIDRKELISKGVSFQIKRADRKRVDSDDLVTEIVASLTLGLARAADDILLTALAAESLTPFTLAKAAAEGLMFDELNGLIGTGGDGAAIGANGVLRAAGIASELTADMAGTIVGAWNRVGVVVHEDVTIAFERANLKGDLNVTAWAHMHPLIPDAAKFWTVEGA